MTGNRPISWAATEAERDLRISRAQGLAGSRITAVRYYDIDYDRETVAPGTVGPRHMVDDADSHDSPWCSTSCHSIDFGLEIDTDRSGTLSIAWDPPGHYPNLQADGTIEGISIEAERLVGSAIREDAEVAVWDVTVRTGWAAHVGATIETIDLRYESWGISGAWWCPRITLGLSSGRVELLLGEVDPDGSISRSPDNLVVVLSPEHKPPADLT